MKNYNKKIGILTYHYSINEGAMLQAFALREICQIKYPDFRVEIIDIVSLKILKRDFLKVIKTKSIQKFFFYLKRFITLYLFSRSFVKSSFFIKENLSSQIKYINSQKYELIIVGSDEVWKVGAYEDFARGFPNIYFLPKELNCKIKTSYAASANKTRFDILPKEKLGSIKSTISSINHISVRDDYTKRNLELLINKEVVRVLDPTFLFDFSDNKKLVEHLFNKYGIDRNKKIALYVLEDKSASRICAEILHDNNYQIVAIGYYNKFADFNISNFSINPIVWQEFFGFSNFCLTDRFHGTVFSIKNNIPFLSFDNGMLDEKHPSKLFQLLENFDMLDHYIQNADKLKEQFDTIRDKRYDFSIRENLNYQKRYSMDFISSIKI